MPERTWSSWDPRLSLPPPSRSGSAVARWREKTLRRPGERVRREPAGRIWMILHLRKAGSGPRQSCLVYRRFCCLLSTLGLVGVIWNSGREHQRKTTNGAVHEILSFLMVGTKLILHTTQLRAYSVSSSPQAAHLDGALTPHTRVRRRGLPINTHARAVVARCGWAVLELGGVAQFNSTWLENRLLGAPLALCNDHSLFSRSGYIYI